MLKLIPPEKILSLEEARQREWDVIVVGAGMGGGTAAYKLAESGLKVLCLDKGAANFDANVNVAIEPSNEEEQYTSGKWPTQIRTAINGTNHDMWAPLGCGFGGSSLLYAAALQRLSPSDFDEYETPTGSKIGWPVNYKEMEPFYQQAEKLFSVCGTQDPLDKESFYSLANPPAMCEQDQHFFAEFKNAGLHPFRLHVGIQYKKGCGECGGNICPQQCKRDAYNSCLVPALETGNLFVCEYASAQKLHEEQGKITALDVEHDGLTITITAKAFVLGAGAYFSPLLLLKSRNNSHPNGLANQSGLVGRNLMFHACDFFGVWPLRKCSREGPNKTIGVRDLYTHDGERLGEFQSTGLAADYGLILFALRKMFDQSIFSKISPLRHFLRIPAKIASKLYGEATVFATNLEDFPYEENRIIEDDEAPAGMRFEYTVHDELKQRVFTLRKLIKKKLKHLRIIQLNPQVDLNYGHPCGTLRAGINPQNSVLDKNCKAHELENLYAVDASVMPTSGGTNPSLTIAANALRVAEHIAKSLKG